MNKCNLGILEDIDKVGYIEVTGCQADGERIIKFTKEGLEYLTEQLNNFFHM